jgi:outer membrane receptor protein involved in Fe transport
MVIAVTLLISLSTLPGVTCPCGHPQAQATQPADATTVTGSVRDVGGGAVAGASVIVRGGPREQHATTGPDGRFAIAASPANELVLIVRAPGFAEVQQKLPAGTPRTNLELVVVPAGVIEAVTVTATRGEQRTGDIPASVNLLERQDIRQSPALVADDVLRQIPTFSLFRRTSSLASHPTAQGVSLRGIGPSGVSRTLVLVDGVPINDPFGGWVYWSRVPLESAERVEVVDSNTSSLYGWGASSTSSPRLQRRRRRN